MNLRTLFAVLAVATLACSQIVDTCACTLVPAARVSPAVLTLAVGDSAQVESQGLTLYWHSSDSSVTSVSDTVGVQIFVTGRDAGRAWVIGSLGLLNADSVLVVVER